MEEASSYARALLVFLIFATIVGSAIACSCNGDSAEPALTENAAQRPGSSPEYPEFVARVGDEEITKADFLKRPQQAKLSYILVKVDTWTLLPRRARKHARRRRICSSDSRGSQVKSAT